MIPSALLEWFEKPDVQFVLQDLTPDYSLDSKIIKKTKKQRERQ